MYTHTYEKASTRIQESIALILLICPRTLNHHLALYRPHPASHARAHTHTHYGAYHRYNIYNIHNIKSVLNQTVLDLAELLANGRSM